MKKMNKDKITVKDSKNNQGAKVMATPKVHITKAKPAPVKDPNGPPINGCRPTGQI